MIGVAGKTNAPSITITWLMRVRFWVALLSILAVVSIWKWAWNVTVIDYGRPDQTFFDTTQASPGQKIGLWFGGVTWRRVCRSELHSHVTCRVPDPLNPGKTFDGRLDFEPHIIDNPTEPGSVPLKRRDFTVPEQCLPGPLTWSSQATSYCFPFGELNPRYASPPDLHLTVK